jgi:hypothetical protein|tara:strand:+ start:633 stop:881 length:249 start_codon:yes stop_codon:yes gene_type:complete
MFFGATPFASTTFAGVGIQNITVLANGNRLNIAIGNTTVDLVTTVNVTGQQFNLANNPVSVISWNPIPPGVNQVWVPIDPDA